MRERLLEAEYVLTPNGTKLFIGTPHTYYSIYSEEQRLDSGEDRAFLAGYNRLEIPVLDDLQQKRMARTFFARSNPRYACDDGTGKVSEPNAPEGSAAVRKPAGPGALRVYRDELVYRESNRTARLTLGDRRLVSASCWWDPAYGAPGKGDANALAAVYTDETGGYWLHRVEYLVHDPNRIDEVDEATQLCRQVAAVVRELHLPAVIVESNGIGRFLVGLLRQQIGRAGLRCAVLTRTSTLNKDLRILEAFDAVLAAGRLSVHNSVAGVGIRPGDARVASGRASVATTMALTLLLDAC